MTVAGVPAAGIELKIVDPDDFDVALPHDGVAQGELLCRPAPTLHDTKGRPIQSNPIELGTRHGWRSIRRGSLLRTYDAPHVGPRCVRGSERNLENDPALAFLVYPSLFYCAGGRG